MTRQDERREHLAPERAELARHLRPAEGLPDPRRLLRLDLAPRLRLGQEPELRPLRLHGEARAELVDHRPVARIEQQPVHRPHEPLRRRQQPLGMPRRDDIAPDIDRRRAQPHQPPPARPLRPRRQPEPLAVRGQAHHVRVRRNPPRVPQHGRGIVRQEHVVLEHRPQRRPARHHRLPGEQVAPVAGELRPRQPHPLRRRRAQPLVLLLRDRPAVHRVDPLEPEPQARRLRLHVLPPPRRTRQVDVERPHAAAPGTIPCSVHTAFLRRTSAIIALCRRIFSASLYPRGWSRCTRGAV